MDVDSAKLSYSTRNLGGIQHMPPQLRSAIQQTAIKKVDKMIQAFGSCTVLGSFEGHKSPWTLIEKAVSCGMLEMQGCRAESCPTLNSVTAIFSSLFNTQKSDPLIDSAIARVFQLVAHRLSKEEPAFATILYAAAASAHAATTYSTSNLEASTEVPLFSAEGLTDEEAAYSQLAVSHLFSAIAESFIHPFNQPCSLHGMQTGENSQKKTAQEPYLSHLRAMSERVKYYLSEENEQKSHNMRIDPARWNRYCSAASKALASGLIGITACAKTKSEIEKVNFADLAGENETPAKTRLKVKKALKQMAPVVADAAVTHFPFVQTPLSSENRLDLSKRIRAATRITAYAMFAFE